MMLYIFLFKEEDMSKRKSYKDDPEYQSDVLDGLLKGNEHLAKLAEGSQKRLDGHDVEIKENREKVKQLDSRVVELEKSSGYGQKFLGMACIIAGLYFLTVDHDTGFSRKEEVFVALVAIVFGLYQCSPNKVETTRNFSEAMGAVGTFKKFTQSSDKGNDSDSTEKPSLIG